MIDHSTVEIRNSAFASVHRDFERALAETKLPERPDYEAANRFLVRARRHQAHPDSRVEDYPNFS
jgi:hypothetical protein